jgi:signal peptidase II
MKAVPASRYILFLSIAAGGCAADLITKQWVFSWLGMPGGQTWWLWQDVAGFQTSLNEGALFGMGQGMVPVFALLSVAAALAILWWLFYAGAAREWLLTIALACVMAGIAGNLFDRLGLPGLKWPNDVRVRAADGSINLLHHAGDHVRAVRDWILVMIGTWPWPTFNIADSLLVCGAGLLLWQAFVKKPDETTEEPQGARQKPARVPQRP